MTRPREPRPRREWGTGSVYRRSSDGRWVASIPAGWTANNRRRRRSVTGKSEAVVKRKLRDLKVAHDRGESAGRITVKAWAETYLAMRVRDLAPKGYNAAASPIRRWVVPTIGHRRLDQLTPGDIRAVADAQRNATDARGPRKAATGAATQRALMTMLRYAVAEGYHVPARVLAAKAPTVGRSDREGMTVPEGLALLRAASELPNGSRWLFAVLYGARQGECLGLTRPAVDLTAGTFGEAVIEWQLQALPYLDRKDKARGFRIPDGYECRHLVDSYHLVRPKSRQGWRVAPLLEPVRDGLVRWLEVAPANPWGLVWPDAAGRPMNDKADRRAWRELQAAAGVQHPSGRPYHVHETRNFAATMLLEAGVDEAVITRLLGHSSVVTSRRYMTVRREPLLDALTRVGERLQLGRGPLD